MSHSNQGRLSGFELLMLFTVGLAGMLACIGAAFGMYFALEANQFEGVIAEILKGMIAVTGPLFFLFLSMIVVGIIVVFTPEKQAAS